MPMSAEVAAARARVAGLTARGAPAAAIESARQSLVAANARTAIQKWQRLPESERIQLAVLILAGGGDATS
jgi:hypothetical protein